MVQSYKVPAVWGWAESLNLTLTDRYFLFYLLLRKLFLVHAKSIASVSFFGIDEIASYIRFNPRCSPWYCYCFLDSTSHFAVQLCWSISKVCLLPLFYWLWCEPTMMKQRDLLTTVNTFHDTHALHTLRFILCWRKAYFSYIIHRNQNTLLFGTVGPSKKKKIYIYMYIYTHLVVQNAS